MDRHLHGDVKPETVLDVITQDWLLKPRRIERRVEAPREPEGRAKPL